VAENGHPAVFIEIPDGHVKGANDEKKPEKPVKSAKKETTPKQSGSHPSGADIEAQGLLVRELKAKDAKSQETKDAIAKLLELKKQYKEATGQDYKPGAAPTVTSSVPLNKTSDNEALLFAAIETQGNLVREVKAKDSKSQETKDAVAKLLDLKKQYKEATGKDYKPSAAPAAKSSNSVSIQSSKSGDDEASLYAAIETQGNLVREVKSKDPKS
uniref:WHEP-TRS domain-containing protein n=1 Tax=Panagrolaimus sp. ES5 TaxID=591445 RepID=A0AC34GGE8_9BILA